MYIEIRLMQFKWQNWCLAFMFGVVCYARVCRADAPPSVTLDFNELAASHLLSGTTYRDLIWEFGSAGSGGNIGAWFVPNIPLWHTSPVVINAYGCTLIGIGFPYPVDMSGAVLAAHGNESGWATGVRVHGYRESELVAVTPWFTDIDATADWMDMTALTDVDRIVFESVPGRIEDGYEIGIYAMDDLTFTPIPEPAGPALLAAAGAAALLRRRRERLSG